MLPQIKFGTSGWRAVMAEEFTFANVRRAVRGIARYVAAEKPVGARVIVGRDPRFLGETFCSIAAEVLRAHGVTPVMIEEAAPTPAIAYAVIQTGADGAINFTASHNPPEYNGIKFSTADGCPALPEVTKRIEKEIDASDPNPTAQGISSSESLDPKPIYLKRLAEIARQRHLKSIVVVSDGTHLFRIRKLCEDAGLTVYTSPRAMLGHIDGWDLWLRYWHEMLSYTAMRLHLDFGWMHEKE